MPIRTPQFSETVHGMVGASLMGHSTSLCLIELLLYRNEDVMDEMRD
jgi:hypothetical protein